MTRVDSTTEDISARCLVPWSSSISTITLTTLMSATLALTIASTALGHGSMAKPISRIYSGFLEGPEHPQSAAVAAAIAVGGTQPFYDWNEVVNFYPALPAQQLNVPYDSFIPDGQIASGGNPKYAGLDLVRDDWPATEIAAGPFEFIFYTTTPHDPSVFHAWITSADWNPLQPLTWGKLESLPLGPVMKVGTEYRFNTIIPARKGKHCIFVVWQRLDPVGEGFYSLSDVDFGSTPEEPCPADLTGDSTVNGADLAVVLGAWNTADADLTNDGNTDGADIAVVLGSWGACGADCDGNGTSDSVEIANGAPDCNVNGVPDSCEPLADCDGDGIVDVCAILEGQVEDCNQNLIPDSCEIAEGGDANGDGYLDDCQITGLTYAWSVSSQWSGGFVGALTIHNGSDQMIHGWTLKFDTPSYTIGNLWDGVLIGQANGIVTVANETWNGHVHEGDSVTIGFVGTGAPGAPTSVILNQSPVLPAP